MRRSLIKRLIIVTIIPVLLLLLSTAQAQTSTKKDSSGCYTDSKTGRTICQLSNPLQNNVTNLNTIMGGVVAAALGLVGALSLYAFVTGGFTWLTSAGNPERVKKGMYSMLWAAAGVLVTFIAYGLLNFLITKLLTNT